MNSEFKSKIEVDEKTGRKSLIVFYNSGRDDYNEAIKEAVAFHKLEDSKISVIALPENCHGTLEYALSELGDVKTI